MCKHSQKRIIVPTHTGVYVTQQLPIKHIQRYTISQNKQKYYVEKWTGKAYKHFDQYPSFNILKKSI